MAKAFAFIVATTLVCWQMPRTGKFKYVKEGGVESFESVTPTEAKEGAYVSKISGNTQTGSWQYGSHVYTVANGKITDLPAYA